MGLGGGDLGLAVGVGEGKERTDELQADFPRKGVAGKLVEGAGEVGTAGIFGGEGVAKGFDEFEPNFGDLLAGFVEGFEFFGMGDAGFGGGELGVEGLEEGIGVGGERGDVGGGAGVVVVEGGLKDAAGEGMQGKFGGKPGLDEKGKMTVVASMVEKEDAEVGLRAGREGRAKG